MSPGTARDRLLFILLCTAQCMVILDITVTNVALPSIGRELHVSGVGLQWVVSAYTLMFAGCLLVGGRAADLFGQRPVFVLGAALFTVASAVAGAAPDLATLVVARGMQGVGGAILSPTTLMILTTSFGEPHRRAKALALFGGLAAAGGAAGNVLSGVLTDLVGWRSVLFVNVPVGLFAIFLGHRLLLNDRLQPAWRQLDPIGAALVTAGMIAIVYGTVNTERQGWTAAMTIGALLAGTILIGLFLLHQAYLAGTPILPMTLLRKRTVAGANSVLVLLSATTFSTWYFQSLFLQNVRGLGPMQTGLAFLPMSAMTVTGSYISARILALIGLRRLMMTGCGLAVAGLILLGRANASDSVPRVVVPGALVTLGMAICLTPMILVATAVQRDQAGVASGLVNVARQSGVSLGLAALAAVAAARTKAFDGSGTSRIDALASGYQHAFLVSACLVVVGCTTSLTLRYPGHRS